MRRRHLTHCTSARFGLVCSRVTGLRGFHMGISQIQLVYCGRCPQKMKWCYVPLGVAFGFLSPAGVVCFLWSIMSSPATLYANYLNDAMVGAKAKVFLSQHVLWIARSMTRMTPCRPPFFCVWYVRELNLSNGPRINPPQLLILECDILKFN